MRRCGIICAAALCLTALLPAHGQAVLSVAEAAEYMQEIGLPTDRQAAERAALDALILAADPKGLALTEAEATERDAEAFDRGLHYGFLVGGTGAYPRIVHRFDEAAEGLPDADAALIAVESHRLQDVPVSAVNGWLLSMTNESIECTWLADTQTTTQIVRRAEYALPGITAGIALEDHLFYYRVHRFGPSAGNELVEALKANEAGASNGLILDLRHSGGRHLESVARALDAFAREGDLLFKYMSYRDEELMLFEGRTPPVIENLPVMLLVNDRTRDGAEVFAYAMKALYGQLLIVGHETAGYPMTRTQHRLSSGDILYLRTRKLITSAGRIADGLSGLTPDLRMKTRSTPLFSPTLVTEGVALKDALSGDACVRRSVDILLGIRALHPES